MLDDVEAVRQVTRVVLTIAAIPVTVFPLLYFIFSPWYKSQLGRAVMLQSLAVAFAIDFSVVYQYWAFTTSLYALVVIRLCMFVFVGLAGFYLTGMLVYYLLKSLKASKQNVSEPPGSAGRTAPFSE